MTKQKLTTRIKSEMDKIKNLPTETKVMVTLSPIIASALVLDATISFPGTIASFSHVGILKLLGKDYEQANRRSLKFITNLSKYHLQIGSGFVTVAKNEIDCDLNPYYECGHNLALRTFYRQPGTINL